MRSGEIGFVHDFIIRQERWREVKFARQMEVDAVTRR